jgi:hypothetical protein
MDVRVDVDASDPLQMLDAVEVAPTLEWPPFLNRRHWPTLRPLLTAGVVADPAAEMDNQGQLRTGY